MKYIVINTEDRNWILDFIKENLKIIPDYVSVNPIELSNGNFAISENVLFSEELKELREKIELLPGLLDKLIPVEVLSMDWKKYPAPK